MATNSHGMFTEPPAEKSFPTAAIGIAAAVVLVLVLGFVFLGHKKSTAAADPNTLQPLAAYAPSLTFSDLQMSESDLPTGGQQLYIDGHITNNGPSTVTAITVQGVFANDQSMPPQYETTPLHVVRSRDGYVDEQPVSAEPITPGKTADFRLIFEGVGPNWNQKQPDLRIVAVTAK